MVSNSLTFLPPDAQLPYIHYKHVLALQRFFIHCKKHIHCSLNSRLSMSFTTRMNREALYSATPSAGVHAHHMALRQEARGTNAYAFDTIENPLMWWLLRLSYPSNRNFGCCNEVTPEPPEPKNINVGKHAHAHVD